MTIGRTALVLASTLLLSACAGMSPWRGDDASVRAGGESSPNPYAGAEYGELLAALDTLPPGQPVPLGSDRSAVAEGAYAAASGRVCRQVSIRSSGSEDLRLACKAADVWNWFPYVLPR
jgi:hypothetical protein